MNDSPKSQRPIQLIDGSQVTVGQSLAHCALHQLSSMNELTGTETTAVAISAVPTPLLVVRDDEAHFSVIDGAKRLASYVHEKMASIPCVILEGNLTTSQKALLRMTMNADRPLTMSEKIVFCRWVRTHLPDSDLSKILGKLGITKKEQPHLIRLAGEDQSGVEQAVIRGAVSLQAVDDFLGLSPADRTQILTLLETLKPSVQLQKELFQWLPEIASAKQTRLSSLIDAPEVCEIIGSKTLNPPQKLQKLRSHFYRLRFPTVSVAEKRWKQRKQAICRPEFTMAVVADPYFEKRRTEIRIQAQSGKEMTEALRWLGTIDKKQWDLLIDPYRDDD